MPMNLVELRCFMDVGGIQVRMKILKARRGETESEREKEKEKEQE